MRGIIRTIGTTRDRLRARLRECLMTRLDPLSLLLIERRLWEPRYHRDDGIPVPPDADFIASRLGLSASWVDTMLARWDSLFDRLMYDEKAERCLMRLLIVMFRVIADKRRRVGTNMELL